MSVLTAPAATTDTLAALAGGDGLAGAINALDDKFSALITTDVTDITASAAELNILDGVTADKDELNVLDGIPSTLTSIELGYLDGVTSAVQTQLNARVDTTGNETIADIKTFSSFPVTPSSAPTTNYQTSNKKYVDDQVGAITVNRSFTWGLLGGVSTGDELGMKYICPQALTVTNLRAKTGSGTATIRIQQGTTNIDASASVTSSAGNITSFDSTSIAAGVVVTLDVTAVSSCVDLFVTLECTQ